MALEPLFPHRRRALWALLIVGLVFVASSRSTVAGPAVTHADKVVHFAVYGLIGTLLCRSARPGWSGACLATVIASVYGAADEWHQSFVPGRSAEIADWVADTLGAMTAAWLYTRWRWYRDLLERPIRPGKRRIEPTVAARSVALR